MTVALRIAVADGVATDIVSRGRYVGDITQRHDIPIDATTDGSSSTSRRDRDDPSYEALEQ